MMIDWIALLLQNFGFSMLILALFFILLSKIINPRLALSETVFRWIVVFPLGFTAIYAFIFHAFCPQLSAQAIGWQPSPFQFEVAMANLGFGVIAILAFKASLGFRLATVIGNTLWLWGDAVGHIYQMVINNNYAIGNAGSWFWMDVFIPLILILSIIQLRKPAIR